MCPHSKNDDGLGNDCCVNQEEQSAFLSHTDDDNQHHRANNSCTALASSNNPSSTAWLKNWLTVTNFVYLAGLYVVFSKTKSRCTPPKSFNLDEYLDSSTTSKDIQSAEAATAAINNSSKTNKQRIPKIIHQSYKSMETLPKVWASTPSRWKKLHPDYEYKFWSDQDNRNLIQQYYPWFLSTYDSYPAPIQRADAARYFAVLHYGGIYADMDILPIRNVDPLLDKLNNYSPDDDKNNNKNSEKEMIVAETYNLGLTNALFASIPNSTILEQFVRELPLHTKPLHGLEFFIPHFAVLLSTGPTRLWIYLNHHREKILTLNPAGWGQCHQCKQHSATCIPQEGSFFETTKGGSWHKWDTRIMNFIFCHVHFVVWGVGCLLVGVYFWYLENKKKRSGGSSNSKKNGKMRVKKSGDEGLELTNDNGGRGKDEKGDLEENSLLIVSKAASNNKNFKSEDEQYNSKEKRAKNPNLREIFGSFDNFVFFSRFMVMQHRFELFCVIILFLVF